MLEIPLINIEWLIVLWGFWFRTACLCIERRDKREPILTVRSKANCYGTRPTRCRISAGEFASVTPQSSMTQWCEWALLNNKAQSLNLILELRTSHRSPPSQHWCMCLRDTTLVDYTLFIKSVDNSMVCIRAEMSTVFSLFFGLFQTCFTVVENNARIVRSIFKRKHNPGIIVVWKTL